MMLRRRVRDRLVEDLGLFNDSAQAHADGSITVSVPTGTLLRGTHVGPASVLIDAIRDVLNRRFTITRGGYEVLSSRTGRNRVEVVFTTEALREEARRRGGFPPRPLTQNWWDISSPAEPAPRSIPAVVTVEVTHDEFDFSTVAVLGTEMEDSEL